ncbi:MAG: hypothetical protein ACI4RD_08690 [Kiritimatiellia bacterium]
MSFTTGRRLALAALAGFAAGAGQGDEAVRTVTLRGLPAPVTVLDAWTFEADVCGRMPRGWWAWGAKNLGEAENSRWVSNAASADGRQSLLLDFSQLPPVSRAGASPTGYTSCRLKPAAEGWAVLAFCFRREEGKTSLEVRGPHRGGVHYQIFGCDLAETVRLRTGVGKGGGSPVVGHAPANAWRRLTLCFPLDNALAREVYVRFDERRGADVWQEGAWARHPLGEVVLTGAPGPLCFNGYGRQKLFLDSFLWGVTPKAPFAGTPVQTQGGEHD